MYFSVIIPIYNVENYLKECIDSVLSQSFKDFEIILVDDGSTDSSSKICDEYADKYKCIKVIHKENGGLSDARNFGLDAAKGEYIVFLDSDDFLNSDSFLEILYSKTKDSTEVVVYKFQKYLDEIGKVLPCTFKMPDFSKDESLSNKILSLVEKDAFYCTAWSKCIKRNVLIDNDIKFEKGLIGEDQEWYFHVLSAINTFDCIDISFIMYRQRAGSISHTFSIKNLDDCLSTLKKWSNYYCAKRSDFGDACLNALGKLYCNLLIGFVSLNDSDKKARKNELKELAYLLNYSVNHRTKLFSKIYNLFGFNGLIALLTIIVKVKKI